MRVSDCRFKLVTLLLLPIAVLGLWAADGTQIGREVAIPRHLQDGEEFTVPLKKLLAYGERLFRANFTIQEGAGRPLSKGTGAPLSDPSSPLVFPCNFNRLSSPEANSCAGCHNEPFAGGGGDRVTEVFVLAQRFDFATFDHSDTLPTRGAADERAAFVTHDEHPVPDSEDLANERKTISMNGSGFIEMLARQMSADLQAIAQATPPGTSSHLVTKGVSFGTITHNLDGTWDTSRVEGLPPKVSPPAARRRPPSSSSLSRKPATSSLSGSSPTTP